MFNKNGFVITDLPIELNKTIYAGVDTNAWPIFDIEEIYDECDSEKFSKMTDCLEIGLKGASVVDLNLAQKYADFCAKTKRPHRVLYIETMAENDFFDVSLHNKYGTSEFLLGYDVAFCSGNFYSAILNDIINRKGAIPEKFETLNDLGLFQTYPAAQEFLCYRKNIGDGVFFEKCELQVVAVYEIKTLFTNFS